MLFTERQLESNQSSHPAALSATSPSLTWRCLCGRIFCHNSFSFNHFLAPIAQSDLFWGQKCSFLAWNSFFGDITKKNCYHHDGTPKRQHFCVYRVAGQAHGGAAGSIFGPKLVQKADFFTLHPYSPLLLGSDGPDSMES